MLAALQNVTKGKLYWHA